MTLGSGSGSVRATGVWVAGEAGAAFRGLGHATVLRPGPPLVAADPWRWRLPKAKVDVVLVTHGHADHCSEEDIAAASHERTRIVAPRALRERLERTFPGRVHTLEEGKSLTHEGTRVLALPAEGPPRARGFHRRGDGLSYLVEFAGARHLLCGDSDALPEHEGLAPDVAYIAVGGMTVMDPREAADAAARIRPALAVPVHWGDLSARFGAARRFVEFCAERGVHAALPAASPP